ncbi:40S ribosomal protein SA [Microtus ochrogaster]|uniref:40S ribosomal protein SA n=1 Tax=Microtus ochrogaster TaxID=79684 RepID=A0A8J6GVI7_MICOH|nr:40S ribosomal protein SA [Microtus ochrogaster]
MSDLHSRDLEEIEKKTQVTDGKAVKKEKFQDKQTAPDSESVSVPHRIANWSNRMLAPSENCSAQLAMEE